jgi:hypothetical protein
MLPERALVFDLPLGLCSCLLPVKSTNRYIVGHDCHPSLIKFVDQHFGRFDAALMW